MATITSVASGNWGTAGTWDSGVPVNGDTVIIAEGHTVLFDVDQSGFATGLVNLTINGILNFKHDSVTYLKWSGKIQGNGILNVGTVSNPISRPSLGSSTPMATIHYTGDVSTAYGAIGMTSCKMYGWIPETANYTYVKGDHDAGVSTIVIQDDIDIQNGDEIIIGQGSINNWLSESPKGKYTVTNYDPNTKSISINPILGSDRYDGDIISIYTRPILLKSTKKPSYVSLAGIYNMEGVIIDQLMVAMISSATITPLNHCTFSNATPIFYVQNFPTSIENCTIYSTSSGTQCIKNAFAKTTFKNCALINAYTIINTGGNVLFDNCVFQNLRNSSTAIYNAASSLFKNCKFKNIPLLGLYCKDILIDNCEFSDTDMAISPNGVISDQIESFDHNQQAGNYKAWCKGGTIETDTDGLGNPIPGHLIFTCESADYPVFRDFPMLLAAYKTNRWQALVNKSFTGGEVKIELIDPTSDPLIDSEATPLASYSLPDQADTNLPLKLGYKSDKAMQAILRISATNSEGTVEVDSRLIENRVQHG